MKKILVMGLPGSGKTTFAKTLAALLGAVHFNGDDVREQFPGLGFSHEDRIKQAERMGWLCDQVNKSGYTAIADFICPTHMCREAFGKNGAYKLVYMNAIKESAYKDTDAIFEAPQYDFMVPSFPYDDATFSRLAKIFANILEHPLDMSFFAKGHETSLMIGRFQCIPPHEGHTALIDSVLAEGKRVCIGLREENGTCKNPYSIADRKAAFEKIYGLEIAEGRVMIIPLPNVVEVVHGRDVGWGVREIQLSPELQAISATQRRKQTLETSAQ
jgi:energy-coupling factor transporter ATP-binding protein EcfA2